MSFHGKVYAITGGASGIGLATAKFISERGGIVCIADVNLPALNDVVELFHEKNVPLTVSKVDVSSKDEVDSWIKGIVQRFGRLDGAANVAGVIGKDHGLKSVAELDDNEWDKIIAVNLTGCMYCLRAELRHIVDGDLSSMWLLSTVLKAGMALHGAYAASKHGVIGLTQAAAKENGAREVRVNAVAPGAIYTPMMQQYWDKTKRPPDAAFDDPTSFRRQGKPEEVANVIGFLLGTDSSFVSGSVYSVDGAWL